MSVLSPLPHAVAERFIVRIGELLHAYGTPAHRVERRLVAMAEALGLRAHVFSTPTAIHVAFEGDAEERVFLRRVHPGEIDLGKLIEFDDLLVAIEEGRCSLEDATARLEAIASAPPRYRSGAVVALGWTVASGAAAALFGGGLPDVLGAALIGLGLGALSKSWVVRPESTGLFELVAAVLAGFISMVLASLVGPVSGRLIVLASLIVLFPGLTLTLAMVELATRHLASGTARLGGAFTTLLLLAFGVTLGRALGVVTLPEITAITPEPLPVYGQLLAMAVLPIAFGVLFQARARELGWIWLSAVAAGLVGRIGSSLLGVEVGSLLGGLCVGVFSNTFSRSKDLPGTITLAPGLLVLVPGSVGYRAIDLFMAKEAVAGLLTAFETTVIGTALVGGLLIANVVVPPRRAL